MSNHKSVDLLSNAVSLITGARPDKYGSFADNVTDIQMLMKAMTGGKPTRHEVHSFLLALKLSRNKGEGWSEDTLTDLAGYAALIYEDCNT